MVCYAFIFTFLMSAAIKKLEQYFQEPEAMEQTEQLSLEGS